MDGPTVPCGCQCGQMIQQFDASGRERFYVHGHHLKAVYRALKCNKPLDVPRDTEVEIEAVR